MSKSKVAYSRSVVDKLAARSLNNSVQPQNVKSARVYVFGKDSVKTLSDVEDDSPEDTVFEMVKIRPRKAKKEAGDENRTVEENRKVKLITRPVFPNDTLSKFALQYGCTVAELKTTNSLYNEQDFHGLKHIKIPVQPHSLLTERAEEEKRRVNAFVEHDQSYSDHENEGERSSDDGSKVRTVSISANLKDPELFLKRMDDDIQKICQSVRFQKPDINHVTRTLSTQCIRPRTAKKNTSEELGVIWTGCGWKGAVIAFVFIAVILPILYFIYIEKIKS